MPGFTRIENEINFDVRERIRSLLLDDDILGANLEELGDVEQHRHDRQGQKVVPEKERLRIKSDIIALRVAAPRFI